MNSNPLTNKNYINKDFQTIYPELLDLVKKLSYKWDPTISNESDPGVVLIKLNAILADKNNYNIDKNILECFPDTVTQHDNAQKLFEQLGYNMHWYRAAKGEVTFKWKSEKVTTDLTGDYAIAWKVPQFTMVSDYDKEIVYTTLEEVPLQTTGELVNARVIQGVVRDLEIGGSTLITHSMLDANNRVYFPVRNVAENGVFISAANKDAYGETSFIWRNPDTSNSDGWEKVDNLYVYPVDYKCYKFGVDYANSSCYIEFPSDIAHLMGEGLQIKYIQTDGASGNIASRRISKFYTDVEIEMDGEKVNISSDSTVTNYSAITNGEEPESIDDAYVNYKKVVGTFDTLVTLKDYLNYIINDEFEQVSNGVVSDRLNDIQSSYQVVTTHSDMTTTDTIVVSDDSGNPEMTAFDLRTYFLEYSKWPMFSANTDVNSQKAFFKEAYDKSFKFKLSDIGEPLDTGRVKGYYEDAKRIEHNFIPKDKYKPLIFKNKFKLNLTVIPDSIISRVHADDIEKNVYEAVLKNLSAGKVSFGDAVSFERVYDICRNADSRIKAVALDSLEYTPYAVIYVDDPTSFRNAYPYKVMDENGTEIQIKSGLNEIPIPIEVNHSGADLTFNDTLAIDICAKNVLKGATPLYHSTNGFTYTLDQRNVNIIKSVTSASTSSEISFDMSDVNNFAEIDDNTTDHVMLENESLFLYAPYLTTATTYTQSMKYIYYTTKDYGGADIEYIPANADYRLSRGQHLFVFKKDEDSKDAPYLYYRHGEGDIIFPTTRLIKSSHRNYAEICSRLDSGGYEGEGQIIGDLNDKLYEIGDTILSTVKTIAVKEVNASTLTDRNNYCYWITNDVSTDPLTHDKRYGLTLQYVEKNDNEIDASYHSGLVYVSNFKWEPSAEEPIHRLSKDEDEYIYMLEPVVDRVSFNSIQPLSGQSYVQDTQVTNYIVKAILPPGTQIKTNGDIVKSDDRLFNEVSSYKTVGDKIKWGSLKKGVLKDDEFVMYVESSRGNVETVSRLAELDPDGYRGATYKVEMLNTSTTGGQWELSREGHGAITRLNIEEYHNCTSGDYEYLICVGSVNSFTPIVYCKFDSSTPTYTFKIGDYFEISVDENGKPTGIHFFTMMGNSNRPVSTPVTSYVSATLENDDMHKLSNGYRIDTIATDNEIVEDEGTSTFEYVLKANEEFIFTNSDKINLYMHSNGTKVSIEVANKTLPSSIWIRDDKGTITGARPLTLYVACAPPEELQRDATTALKNLWYNFNCVCRYGKNGKVQSLTSGYIVTVIENQILSIGEGSHVRVRRNPIYVPLLDEDNGTYELAAYYDPAYTYLKIDKDGIHHSIDKVNWLSERNVLSNYTIQYKGSVSEESWTELISSPHPSIGWDGYMILHLDLGPSRPQKLSSAHKHKIVVESNNDDYSLQDRTIEPDDTSTEVYVQTSSHMTLIGGDNVDLTGITADGDPVYADMMYYTLGEVPKSDSNSYSIEPSGDDLEVTMEASPRGDLTIEMECSIPDTSDVLLPLEVGADVTVSNFEVWISTCESDMNEVTSKAVARGRNGEGILGGDEPGVLRKGTYYVDVKGATKLKFVYRGDESLQFKLKPLFPYTTTNSLVDNDKNVHTSELEAAIVELDVKDAFDYTYQPPYDTCIYNPLTPNSYFEKTHHCNQFVIPQISTIKIKTVNTRS